MIAESYSLWNDIGYVFFGLLFFTWPIILFVGFVAWRANRGYTPPNPAAREAPAVVEAGGESHEEMRDAAVPVPAEADVEAGMQAATSNESRDAAPTLAVEVPPEPASSESGDAAPTLAVDVQPEPTSDDAPTASQSRFRRVTGIELQRIAQVALDIPLNRLVDVIVAPDEAIIKRTWSPRRSQLTVHADDEFVLYVIMSHWLYRKPELPAQYRCRILRPVTHEAVTPLALDVMPDDFLALPADHGYVGVTEPDAAAELSDTAYFLEWNTGQSTATNRDDLKLQVRDLVKTRVTGLAIRGPGGFTWTTETDDEFGDELRRWFLFLAVKDAIDVEESLVRLHRLLLEHGYKISLQQLQNDPAATLEELTSVSDPAISHQVAATRISIMVRDGAIKNAACLPNMAPALLRHMLKWADYWEYEEFEDIPSEELLPFVRVAADLENLGDPVMHTVIHDFALSLPSTSQEPSQVQDVEVPVNRRTELKNTHRAN